MDRTCVHSCKGLCNALEVAERREQESLTEYRRYASGCDYPDVKQLLDTLVADRERALRLLRETRDMLGEKFNLMDSINDAIA